MFLILPLCLSAAETIYPSGYNLICEYQLSDQSLSTEDTLIITRTFVNNESFTVGGLYFSENMPAEFDLVDYSITRNGSDLTCEFDDTKGPVVAGNRSYYWVVDDPDGSVQNAINPGDIIVLTARVRCTTPDDYTLPIHTAAFYGNLSGFFSTDQPLSISVTAPSDTTPPDGIIDLGSL